MTVKAGWQYFYSLMYVKPEKKKKNFKNPGGKEMKTILFECLSGAHGGFVLPTNDSTG